MMAEVFRRPSLTGLEVLWRWVFWGVVLAWPGRILFATCMQVVNTFQAEGFSALGGLLVDLFWSVKFFAATHAGWLLAALVLWIVLSAMGRMVLLRRVLKIRGSAVGALIVLAVFRWLAWALSIGLWTGGTLAAVVHFVASRGENGLEPEWIPLCATVIGGTLLLFVLWLGLSWVFPLASVYAAQGETLGEALRRVLWRGPLRGKVAEINLVMGIVKIALIVLLMVFSASPLPFQSVETQTFLVTWTLGVLLLYFVASDYFHVVRLLAFVRMTEVYDSLPLEAAARDEQSAS